LTGQKNDTYYLLQIPYTVRNTRGTSMPDNRILDSCSLQKYSTETTKDCDFLFSEN